jgi:hypothetical protein
VSLTLRLSRNKSFFHMSEPKNALTKHYHTNEHNYQTGLAALAAGAFSILPTKG